MGKISCFCFEQFNTKRLEYDTIKNGSSNCLYHVSFKFKVSQKSIFNSLDHLLKKILDSAYYNRIMVFGSVLFWHWEAMLISKLSIRVIPLPFDNIENLLTKSDFKIALNPGSSYEDAFKTSTDPIWKAVWTERIKPFLEDYRSFAGSNEYIT